MTLAANRAPEEILYAVIQQVRPLHRHVARAVELKLLGTGISVGMRAVLEVLAIHGRSTVPQIARHLGIQRQFVQRMIDEAAAAGLTVATANPAHKRSPLLDLSSSGSKAVADIRRREQAELRRICRSLSRQQIVHCAAVMDRLLAEFRRLSGDD